MTGKATTVFLAAMFASQVALTAVSFADGKKGKGGTSTSTVTSLKAKLAPPPTSGPVAVDLSGVCEGGAGYKKKVTTKTPPAPAPASTTTEESFSGEVECPILTDLATAQADRYVMHLARNGGDYALCWLVIKEFEFEYQSDPLVAAGVEGEYAVKVSQKTAGTPPVTTLKQKIGGCTDPVAVSTGLVPAVLPGDTANVFLESDPSTLLLTGTFSANSGHDDDD